MDNAILTAMIAAGSAFLGALVPSLFSLLGKRCEYKNERKAKLEEIRRDEYKLYLETIQTMINDGCLNNIRHLQNSTIRLLLYAGPKVSELVNNYFTDFVQRSIQQNPWTKEERSEYETEIINAMREDCASKGKLKSVEFVRVGL